MSKYRQDKRSLDQFKKDIKSSHVTERRLMQAYVNWLNSRQDKQPYDWKDNGVDNSGEYIEDPKKVKSTADFVLIREGQKPRTIEIKNSKKNNKDFHLKQNHINRALKEDICFINFMGTETDTPSFCILTPQMMAEAIKDRQRVFFWDKWCFKFLTSEFIFHPVVLPND